ncbi:MAG TPA: glycogen debranching N-terminal domain-containing protein [Mycobacteriales bacterium]
MTSPGGSQATSFAGDHITVLEGSSFCRSDRAGDITAHQPHGMFVKDTRIISTWELLVDDTPLVPLAAPSASPFSVTFVCRAASRSPGDDPTVVVVRHRLIGEGMREDITVHNFGSEPLGATLTLVVDSDFADLFAVKDGRARRRGAAHRQVTDGQLELAMSLAGQHRGVRIQVEDASITRGSISWRLAVPPHDQWQTTVHALPVDGGVEPAKSFPADRPVEAAAPSRRLRDWHAATPGVECDNWMLQQAVERSVADLGSLRIPDPGRPGMSVVAAGAPWFMTLFGRDSLLTSLMSLPWGLDLARGTLGALARRQGTHVDPLSEEEPGKILHEVRLGPDESTALGGSATYYGSADATPLFVVLLAEAVRWGLPAADLEELLPAADRCLAWIEEYGDQDGDGFIEYQRKTDRGLINQGWKDSHDSINGRDGRVARGPIALAEVQAYAYAAFLGRAQLAAVLGDELRARNYEDKARRLRQQFDEAFWLPRYGYYAIALDGDKRPVDGLASNQGHCLWAGIAQDEHAQSVAEHLLSPAMFSGWGIRTLAQGMGAFNPISYHNGSVWPHDNALAVAGLARYGHNGPAARVAAGVVEASATFGGRLPELFCGFDRSDFAAPIGYPTACSPQAWAAAAPLAILSTLLHLEPDSRSGTVRAANALPDEWGRVRLTGVTIGDRRVDIDSDSLPRCGPHDHNR